MIRPSRAAFLAVALMIAACGGGGATTAPTGTPTTPTTAPSGTPTTAPTATATASAEPSDEPSASASTEPSASASTEPSASASTEPTDAPVAVCINLPAEAAGDLLETICERGTILVATDPAYPPQSELLPDGTFEGFDIDTANAIGERLGVEVQFETPDFAEVQAGGWAERFDISVGSVTITETRVEDLDFTQPYYYTPAQMAATEDSAITALDGLAGMTVCTGEQTTYFSWLEDTLSLVGSPEPATPPEGVIATTFSTDTECADAVIAGRTEFEGWLTSSTTLYTSIEAGAPFVLVGEPVFYEALAVALDKSAPDHDQLLAAIDGIIGDMHEDGTLSASSLNWFTDAEGNPLDYTKTE